MLCDKVAGIVCDRHLCNNIHENSHITFSANNTTLAFGILLKLTNMDMDSNDDNNDSNAHTFYPLDDGNCVYFVTSLSLHLLLALFWLQICFSLPFMPFFSNNVILLFSAVSVVVQFLFFHFTCSPFFFYFERGENCLLRSQQNGFGHMHFRRVVLPRVPREIHIACVNA